MIRLLLALLAAAILIGAIATALVIDSASEDVETPQAFQSPAPVLQSASPTPQATVAAATAVPAPTSLPDRTSCAEIRDTPYRSDAERAFFLTNCIVQAPAGASAPSVSVSTSAACTTDIRINTTRNDTTFDVSGMTVDEINASLDANGPVVDGQKAAGVTRYSYGLNGSFCTSGGSCRIGEMNIHADILVTLPRLTTLAAISPQLRAAWEQFYETVRVHENRHVTIVEEGMAEIRRRLLLLEAQPSCDAVDRAVDQVWLLGSTQMEQRQQAFHAADSAGQGGSVVR
jgi:predicted secreted Zn-dependent protease